MELLEDGLLAFLSAVGLTACVWLIGGALLGAGKCRSPELVVLLPLFGDAPNLEADVRDLLRLRHTLPGATIVLADCGMTEEARELAEYLCRRFGSLKLCPGEEWNMKRKK